MLAGARLSHQRGVVLEAQAGDRDRRQADYLAHHEDLFGARVAPGHEDRDRPYGAFFENVR